jgi:signal transduction histidine kinase/CheY-like chemotaxis protein
MLIHDDDAGLTHTMNVRRRWVIVRLIVGAVQGAAFGLIVGWVLAAAWVTVYWIVQGVEVVMCDYQPRAERPLPALTSLVLLSGNNLAYGAMAILSTLKGGPWGLACGVLFLAGSVVNTAITTQRSRIAFLVAMVPFVFYLIAEVALGWRLSGSPAVAVAAGTIVAVLLFSINSLWDGAAAFLRALDLVSAEAERRRLEAESAVAAKSTFVAMISHELRTPITAILAGADAIARGHGGDAEKNAHAALIIESGRMMRTLLNDLLDLSKMDAGRMSVEAIPFDLPALISDTAAFWKTEARSKGLYVAIVGLDQLPSGVAGDPTRLRQILNNLFSNALKFTENGGVTLTVEAAETPDIAHGSIEHLRFTVRDTGAGMTEAQLLRLFTPFDQTQDSTARTHGGTGLGLTISRELARLMGGDLTASSQPGEGSTFTFELAFASVDESLAESPSEIVALGGGRVLVVDDHEINRRALALMLEPLGLRDVVAVDSATAALELAAVQPFDVILMDLYMPGMGGREACHRLRAAPGPNQATPVIACTASTEARDWEECRLAGMTGQVAKPIDPGDLYIALVAAFESSSDERTEARVTSVHASLGVAS